MTDNSDANNTLAHESGDVPQKDSETVVLEFLAEHQVPMGPKSLYGGLLVNRTINFKFRTVQNRLSDLLEEEKVERVRVDTETDEVVPLGEGEGRGYYLITKEGLDEVESQD
jgi:hypothetical protein